MSTQLAEHGENDKKEKHQGHDHREIKVVVSYVAAVRPYKAEVAEKETIRDNLVDYMLDLQHRLRRVRVCCGDWKRILGPSPTTCIGLTGVFLDPPYSKQSGRDHSIYNVEDLYVAHEVREWAIAHGHDPKLRIALCGYEGEHDMPGDWECVSWKANGGYGNQAAGQGRANSFRERIWFSPYCLKLTRGAR